MHIDVFFHELQRLSQRKSRRVASFYFFSLFSSLLGARPWVRVGELAGTPTRRRVVRGRGGHCSRRSHAARRRRSRRLVVAGAD